MIIGKKEIVLLYEFFYSQKYGNKSYKFKPTIKAISKIEEFISLLDERYKIFSLGSVFLSRYFSFQFQRLDDQDFKRFASKNNVPGRVQIYDIVGKKALECWINRDTAFDFTLNQEILNSLIQKKVPYNNKSEEVMKKRFFNTDRGFLTCLETTTLYDHKSSTCILCNHNRDCKKILEVNYNQIFKERGYGRATVE